MATVEAVADRGSYVIADKVLALIRAIYNWASATGRLEVDPTRGLKKRNASRPRERILSKAEIRSLWCDLDASSISLEIRDALGLQLLLGLRISEVLGANKSEINLVHRVWIIPAARTKSNREQRLPLPPLAASILQSAIQRTGDSPLLFPSQIDNGTMRPKSAMRAILRLRTQRERPRICSEFENWCEKNRRLAFPCTPDTIAAWAKSLAVREEVASLSQSAVRGHISAVVAAQRAAGNVINRKHPAIVAAMRLAPDCKPQMGAARFGFSSHDLRRTLATGLGDLGISDEVIARILNHAPRTVTGRHYNHAAHFEPMRRALEAWETNLLAIVEGTQPEANVATLCVAGV